MFNLFSLDYFITLFLRDIIPHHLFFNSFFSFFSLKGSFIFVWLLVMLIVLILEERKNPGITKQDKKFIIIFFVSFLLTFLLSDLILKNIFLRPRPIIIIGSENLTPTYGTVLNRSLPIQLITACPTDFSFPSTHATTAFAAATVLSFFDKKRRWFYYLVAIIISYSRIYLGCHYFFDVLIGALIGFIISKLIIKIFKSYGQKSWL